MSSTSSLVRSSASTAFRSFLRFPLGSNPTQGLFAAWLGKPLIIYTHHGDFAGAADQLLAGLDFINERVAPQSVSISDLVHDNHQVLTNGRSAMVRVFANDVVINVPEGAEELGVAKEGRDIPWESEAILVDGGWMEPTERSGTTLRVAVRTEGSASVRVRFLPTGVDHAEAWQRANPHSRARRRLTEAGDRLAPGFRTAGGRP